MRQLKRLLALLLTLTALAALLAAPAAALQAPKAQTVIMTNKGQYVTIDVYSMAEGQRIKPGSIKSSNKSVLAPTFLSYHLNWDESLKGKEDSKNQICYIYLKAKKPGTAKISYTIGKKTYTTKVTVKKYSNPLKSFQITSYKCNKNLASAFNKTVSASAQLTGNAKKKGNISVQAASGWKVRSVEFENAKTGESISYNFGWKGVAKANVPVPELMKKNLTYCVSIILVNAKLDQSTYLYYYLEGES